MAAGLPALGNGGSSGHPVTMRPTALLLAVALLAACGGDDDTSSDASTATSDDAPLISVLPAADDASGSEPVELPTSFPADVPIPADVELANAEEHVGASSTIFEVTGWYDGDPIRVARDYEAVLEDLGYEITSRTESPDNLYFVTQGDEWLVSAGFFPDPIRNEGASVGITVAPVG